MSFGWGKKQGQAESQIHKLIAMIVNSAFFDANCDQGGKIEYKRSTF
jgi:hypothetical protein